MKSKTKPETQPVPESAVVATDEPKPKRNRAKRPTLELVKDAEPKPKRTKRAQAAQEPDGAEPAPEPSTEPTPTKHATGRKASAMTLSQLAEKYLASLEADGRSDATVGAYRSDLKIAAAVLGADTAIDTLRPADVQRFNESEPVVLSRAGQPKAQPTIERTRRVLRLALDHAEAEGWIVTTPCVEPD